jgi:selenide,water dikinase
MAEPAIRLTGLSHGGGCGCKIAPSLLGEMLAALPRQFADPALMVGAETSDDAAVYRINDHQAVVASTDFFMPIVDEPFDFGRIAATNALSDIYATGARPLLALAVVGMPVDKLPVAVVREILAGGAAACAAAGVPIAGGHSIDTPEPIYGLAAVGLIDPEKVKRNTGAKPDDVLILGKALGVGILAAALKQGALGEPGYAEMLAVTTQLNVIGTELAEIAGIHAMTDVTGFGLLGHLLEVCRGSNLAAELDLARLPLLPAARALAEQGVNTGAAGRNWASYGDEVALPGALPAWQRHILCEPQTSGGLLVCCAPAEAARVLQLFHDRGYEDAAVIGAMATSPAKVPAKVTVANRAARQDAS